MLVLANIPGGATAVVGTPQGVADFIDRAQADGGTIEALDYFTLQLQLLGFQNDVYLVSATYFARVEADSGVFDSKTDVETILETFI